MNACFGLSFYHLRNQKDSISLNAINTHEDRKILLSKAPSAIYAHEKYGITDIEILEAIACHTTGRPKMSKIDTILFIWILSNLEENHLILMKLET